MEKKLLIQFSNQIESKQTLKRKSKTNKNNGFFTFLRCQGRVFEAEKQVTKKAAYHKKCFTCTKVETRRYFLQIKVNNFI